MDNQKHRRTGIYAPKIPFLWSGILTASDREILARWASSKLDSPDPELMVFQLWDPAGFNGFVRVDEDYEEQDYANLGLSPDLINALSWAKGLGCPYVRLSPDVDDTPPRPEPETQPLSIYYHPQETWDEDKCAQIVGSFARDPAGTLLPVRGLIGYPASRSNYGSRYGRVVYNGGCEREGRHWDGEEFPFPILPAGYSVRMADGWGYQLVRADSPT